MSWSRLTGTSNRELRGEDVVLRVVTSVWPKAEVAGAISVCDTRVSGTCDDGHTLHAELHNLVFVSKHISPSAKLSLTSLHCLRW
jgi:hypothetical protein